VAEFEKLDERRVSGRGVLKVPPRALEFAYYTMFVDLLRVPSNRYLTREWNPFKSVYARMAFRRDEYVIFDQMVEYEKQQFTYVNDPSGQTLIAVKCAYEGVLQSFVNLVTGLSGTPGGIGIFVTGVENKIQDFKTTALGWDEVLFKCYGDAALLIRFYGAKYDQCNPLQDETERPPAPPLADPPLPPGTPLDDLSPPYDPETNDDGNTQPFEGDDTNYDFPVGNDCDLYTISLTVFSNTTQTDRDEEYTLFAPIGQPYLGEQNGSFGIIIECRGVIQGGVCIALQELLFLNSSFVEYENLRVNSITPV
jgi:hypothetical protein